MNELPMLPTPENLAHGMDQAVYRGGPGVPPYYRPAMDCMCGFSTGRCDSWEDAGRAFDAHMREVQKS